MAMTRSPAPVLAGLAGDAARTTTGGCPYGTDETRIIPNNGAGRIYAWDAPLGASPTQNRRPVIVTGYFTRRGRIYAPRM